MARDRLGIKPFHYWTDGQGRLAFASEIKALLAFVSTVRVNRRLAQAFLAWSLLDHEAAETMFEDIWRLPPGHALTWEPDRVSPCSATGIWRSTMTLKPPVRQAALIAEFRSRFEESVALHLRSDVPVGTCLSGGLDSSSIVCTVSAELHRRGIWREDWQHTVVLALMTHVWMNGLTSPRSLTPLAVKRTSSSRVANGCSAICTPCSGIKKNPWGLWRVQPVLRG